MPRLLALLLLSLLSPWPSAASPAMAGEADRGARGWRGVFEPRAEAIIPAEVSMRVMAMPRKPGDACREGDVLVLFDSAIPDAAVAAAAARLKAVELNQAGTASLFAKNQATAVEVARTEGETARARLELATAKREAEACRVVAPFGGKIVERRVREFEWANRGAPLLLLVDDSLLRVRFFLPEAQFSGIAVGDRVRVSVPAVSREVWGTVSRLGVVFDPVSRTFDVWADVPNDDDVLRAGMTAEVEWPVTEDGG